MDFTAIDFETANHQPQSACQLGAVVVRQGQVVARHCWLIRPRPLQFNRRNIEVHGITPTDVRDAADFGQLWLEMQEAFANQVLVAHNARFDLGVLRACLTFYQLPVPDLQFTCTRAIARAAWPNHAGYGLRAIADRLGIVFRHHDALEDADACAQVLLAAAADRQTDDLPALEKALRLSRGRAGDWGIGGPQQRGGGRQRGGATTSRGGWRDRLRGTKASTSATAAHRDGSVIVQQRLYFRDPPATSSTTASSTAASSPSENRYQINTPQVDQQAGDAGSLAQLFAGARQSQPLSGQTVVFTGLLQRLERGQAEHLVEVAGGVLAANVTRKTTLLVVGKPDHRTLQAGRRISTKQARAEELKAAGQNLAIDSEQAFLVRCGLPAVSLTKAERL
ncbi:exonuclease domain-containing protein [Planctomycetaceae bacterium SH139]